MKKLILLLLAYMLFFTQIAGAIELKGVVLGSEEEASFETILEESFETSEYDNSICGSAPCITERTTPNPDGDYSTVGLDMVGSYCVKLDATEWVTFTHAAQDQTTVYYMWKWRFADAIDEANERLVVIDTSGTDIGYVYAYSADSTVRALAVGSTLASATTTYNVNTSMWVKVRATEGTGSDTEVCVALWAGSAWVSWACSSSGTTTGDIISLKLENNQDGTGVEYHYIDNVKISLSDFIADPSTY